MLGSISCGEALLPRRSVVRIFTTAGETRAASSVKSGNCTVGVAAAVCALPACGHSAAAASTRPPSVSESRRAHSGTGIIFLVCVM